MKHVILPTGQAPFRYPSNVVPLDGKGLGNTGNSGHNLHFTMVYQTVFVYDTRVPNRLTFAEDDDLWVFINGRLGVDLGGIHPLKGSEVTGSLKADTPALGLVDGGVYAYPLFFPERHPGQSGLIATIPCPLPETPGDAPAAFTRVAAGLAVIRSRRRAPADPCGRKSGVGVPPSPFDPC